MKQRLRALFRRHRTAVFTVLALVVGLLAGLAGAALIGGVVLVEDAVGWLDDQLGWGRFIPLLTVPVGLVVVWALGQRYREVRGSGVPVTIAGVTIRSGYISTRSSYLKILATALTIGSGGSAGREAWNEVLHPAMTTGEAEAQFDLHRHHGLPVADDDGRLVGILTLSDISRTGGASEELTVGEVMTVRPVTVTPDTPVSLALERMASLGVGRLPVVAEEDPLRLVGMFRRETAVKAYHFALQEVTESVLQQKRQQLWARPGAEFFEFHIPADSVADGRLLREVDWPTGCTLVSIRRGRSVLIPEGNTELQAEDVVTAFGGPASRNQVLERLRQPSAVDTADPAQDVPGALEDP